MVSCEPNYPAENAMKHFVAVESASGRLIACDAKDAEDAYHVIGRKVLGMTEPIDTGNVDVDLYELPSFNVVHGGAKELGPKYGNE